MSIRVWECIFYIHMFYIHTHICIHVRHIYFIINFLQYTHLVSVRDPARDFILKKNLPSFFTRKDREPVHGDTWLGWFVGVYSRNRNPVDTNLLSWSVYQRYTVSYNEKIFFCGKGRRAETRNFSYCITNRLRTFIELFSIFDLGPKRPSMYYKRINKGVIRTKDSTPNLLWLRGRYNSLKRTSHTCIGRSRRLLCCRCRRLVETTNLGSVELPMSRYQWQLSQDGSFHGDRSTPLSYRCKFLSVGTSRCLYSIVYPVVYTVPMSSLLLVSWTVSSTLVDPSKQSQLQNRPGT